MPDAIVGSIIGLVGLLLGLLSAEYFRRRSRIEEYSKEVFLKRLEIYEVLYEKLNIASILAGKFEEANIDTVESLVIQTHALVLETARFTDEKGLFINDELIIQCMLTLMLLPSEGTVDELETFKREQSKEFWGNCRVSKLMIKGETGMSELDKLFRGITRAKHESEYIRYFREIKRQRGIE